MSVIPVPTDPAFDPPPRGGPWPFIVAEAGLLPARPGERIGVVLYGRRHQLHGLGELQGRPVLGCQMRPQEPFPEHPMRRAVRRRVRRRIRNSIIVFTDVSGLLEVWQWEEPAAARISLYREHTVSGVEDRREILELLKRPTTLPLARAAEEPQLGREETRQVIGALLRRVRRRSPIAIPPDWLDGRRRLHPVRLPKVVAWIEASDKAGTVRAFWRSLQELRMFDARCGRGERLTALAAVLAPLYAACLQRMQSWVDDLDRARTAHRPEKLSDFRRLLGSANDRHLYRDRADFILRRILANLYGADPDADNVARARRRLACLLGSPADPSPAPSLPNLLIGDAALGFWTADALAEAMGHRPDVDRQLRRLREAAESIHLAREHLRRAGAELDEIGETSCTAIRERLQELREHLNRVAAVDPGRTTRAKRSRMQVPPHPPLHGWLEFYGILRRGGFDLVLGAPRSVRSSHRGAATVWIGGSAVGHSRARP